MEGEAQGGEQELATKMLQIQSKRFYLDVKENKRGKFIKVSNTNYIYLNYIYYPEYGYGGIMSRAALSWSDA